MYISRCKIHDFIISYYPRTFEKIYSMPRLFSIIFFSSLSVSILRILFSIWGIFNPEPIAREIVSSAGVQSLVKSSTVADGMSLYVRYVMILILITSILVIYSGLLMNKQNKFGFYLNIFTNFILIFTACYAGYNMFPGLQYLSALPLIGILMYSMVLDNFILKKR